MKMKRLLLSLCLAILFCFLYSCNSAKTGEPIAEPEIITYYDNGTIYEIRIDGYENGYKYEIKEDGTVKIITHDYNEYEDTIIVPERIAGRPVTALGNDAFYQHKNTTAIILPSTLTTIEGGPFYRCYSLEEIIIPKNVSEIESNPFFRSSSLTRIKVDPENKYYTDIDGVLFNKGKTELISYPEGKSDESYVIPKTVRKLNLESFGYHTKLKRLTILSNVTEFPNGSPGISMFVYPEDITLIVESGSAAEQYAINCELNYEILN